MLELLAILLCLGIVTGGILAVRVSSMLGAIVSAGLSGLFAAACYLLLGAPDVAMAEASIGSGLTSLIFLYAMRRTDAGHNT